MAKHEDDFDKDEECEEVSAAETLKRAKERIVEDFQTLPLEDIHARFKTQFQLTEADLSAFGNTKRELAEIYFEMLQTTTVSSAKEDAEDGFELGDEDSVSTTPMRTLVVGKEPATKKKAGSRKKKN